MENMGKKLEKYLNMKAISKRTNELKKELIEAEERLKKLKSKSDEANKAFRRYILFLLIICSLTFIFSTLKLLNILNWNWIWVLIPCWLPAYYFILSGLHDFVIGKFKNNERDEFNEHD